MHQTGFPCALIIYWLVLQGDLRVVRRCLRVKKEGVHLEMTLSIPVIDEPLCLE